MRLVSLTANQPSFRSVVFNPSGPTFIVAKQQNAEESDAGKTYNGVGKSLLIGLIHFCLGSNKNDALEEAIPNWEFTLKFSSNGEDFTVGRNTSSQSKIVLNGQEMKLREFCSFLEGRAFILSSGSDSLSFRSLLPRFIRPRKESYVAFDVTDSREKPYLRLLATSFLLGLETDLVGEKHRLKQEKDRIKEFSENLSKDSIFRDFFSQDKNPEIELKDLQEQISKLESDLKHFKVAENYHEMETAAELSRRQLQEAKNSETVLTNAIANINESLRQKPDIAPENVIKVYEEAKAKLPEQVIKQLHEVREFHEKLMANRIKRLTSERAKLEQRRRDIEVLIREISSTVDAQLAFLGAHGALEEFVKLSNRLGDLNSRAQKIRDYQELIETYREQTREINIALENETRKTATYLKDAKPILDHNLELFRSYSRRFYPEKPGGLIVENNEGDNQVRFNIEARIQDDASDGINEVKIFCFDLTLLTARHNHTIDFVFHDSRLFGDIDPRQRAMLFRIAKEASETAGVQYIATVNQDQLEGIRDQFGPDEFNETIEQFVRLELTDESPSSKLLGIQVDMHY
jgi:uncharacterized protein YydD (DUF2326 family)